MLQTQALAEVVAREDEQGGFASGQQTLAIAPFHPAKLRQLAARHHKTRQNSVEKIGKHLWREGDEQDEYFFGCGLALTEELGKGGGVRFVQGGEGRPFRLRWLAVLRSFEVVLEAVEEEGLEVGEERCHYILFVIRSKSLPIILID